MNYNPIQQTYSTGDFFHEQFMPTIDYPHNWVFIGTRKRDGMTYDVYQNFITGAQEERNARSE